MNRINTLITIGCFLLFGMLMSCSKDERPRMEARYEARFDLPNGLNTLETHFFLIRDVPTFYLQNLSSRGWSPEEVERIEASRGVLRGAFGQVNFDFIEDISIFVIPHSDRTNKQEMFYLENIPFNQGSELRMLTSISDLTNIIPEEVVDIEVRVKLKQFSPFGVSCILDLGYLIFQKI